MYNIIAVIACILLPLIIIRKNIKKAILEKQSIKQYVVSNKYDVAVYFIFVIGFLVRLVALENYPAGLNQDEASAGYDAYSILNYGMDRKGKSIPVYFIAWGSGQSVLCSYLMLPFIYLFGLSELTIRLPMAIVGCITLIFVYKLLSEYNQKLGIIGLAFFAICPWHIMKCRWALDCNLFPDMVVIAVCIIIKALKSNKMWKFYAGIAFLSLSVYSYATSYMFLPIFIVLLLIYLLKTKKINMYNAIISIIIAGIIALPLILFVIINTFDYNEIKLGFLTIPRLYQNRYEEVASIFSSEVINNSLNNFAYNMKILINQKDNTNYNALQYYGICYIFSLPFTVIGIYKCVTKRNMEKNILNIFAIVSILLLLLVGDANINRLNIVMIPVIMYTIVGIYDIIENNKDAIIPIVALYCISFCCFTKAYIKTQGEKESSFAQGLKEPLQYAKTLDVEKVYITNSFTQPYIYTLFYTQTPVVEFMDTVKYNTKNVAFESIKSFGKYNFYLPQNMNEENVAYVVPIEYEYDETKFKATNFERYMVLEGI